MDKLKLFFAILIISALMASGCVSTKRDRQITLLSGKLPVDTTEVEHINESDVQRLINTTIFLYNNLTTDRVSYVFYVPPLNITPLMIRILETNDSSYISISCRNVTWESEITNMTNYIINQTNQIAIICNLTLDWSKVEWVVSYAT
jgi:hypothetical protein